MRNWILFFLLSVGNQSYAQFFAPAYPNSISKNSLILDYDFSNSSTYAGNGTSISNLAGNIITGTISGSPNFIADPGYLKFNAANSQYLITGDYKNYYSPISYYQRSGVFTVSLWFNPTANDGVVMSDLGSTTISGGYHTADIEMVGGYLKFSVWPKNAILTSASTVTLNTWHHVVFTYTGNKILAYVDGTLSASATETRDGPAMSSLSTSQYFAFAATESTKMGTGAYGSFLLSRVKWYATALTAAEISNMYLTEEPDYDLIYMLDAGNTNSYPGTGTTWNDISGAAKTGTNNAGVSYVASSANGSMYYNGTSGFTEFSFDLNGATTLTIEMWVYPTNLTNGMFVGFYEYDVYLNNGALGYNTSAGDIFGLNSTQTAGFANTWKHYTFVMNAGAVTSNKIYVNGVIQSLAQIQGSPNNAKALLNSGIGRIGSWRINTNYLQQMYVTTFKVYDRELSQSEITKNFNKTKTRHGL